MLTGVQASFSGGSSTGGGGATGGGGGGKVSCINTLALTGTATEALTGNAFSVSYLLNACQSKTRVSMRATDLTTGFVVWNSIPDLAGTIAIWGLPYTLTSYRIDATAVAGSTNTVVATASTILSTLDPLPCTVLVNTTVTTGYWGIYPAIWNAADAQDCGRTASIHMQITNMTTGRVELDYPNLPRSVMIDFEGAIVSYNTPYHVHVDLVASNGDVIATSDKDVVSTPFR